MTARVLDRNEKDLSKITLVVNELASGRSNSVMTVTLTANAGSTTVAMQTCGAGSAPLYVPLTAHAAAEIAAGTMYIPAATILNGSFVVQHANNAQVDRTFLFVCIG